jgi:hypothetical protein
MRPTRTSLSSMTAVAPQTGGGLEMVEPLTDDARSRRGLPCRRRASRGQRAEGRRGRWRSGDRGAGLGSTRASADTGDTNLRMRPTRTSLSSMAAVAPQTGGGWSIPRTLSEPPTGCEWPLPLKCEPSEFWRARAYRAPAGKAAGIRYQRKGARRFGEFVERRRDDESRVRARSRSRRRDVNGRYR